MSGNERYAITGDCDIHFEGMKFSCRPDYVFTEMLERIDLYGDGVPEYVLDLGAHYGACTLIWANRGAKQVVAVEPVHYEILLKNIEENGLGERVDVVRAAAMESHHKRVSLSQIADDGSFTLLRKNGHRTVETSGFDFSLFMSFFVNPIDYFKCDIEGYEFVLFPPTDETRKTLERVRYIDLEIHNPHGFFEMDKFPKEYKDVFYREVMQEFFESCGFENRKQGHVVGPRCTNR